MSRQLALWPFFVALVLVGNEGALSAQAPFQLANCAGWVQQKPNPANAGTVNNLREMYRLGFVAGFALGMLGRLPVDARSDPIWAMLDSQYEKGLVEALQRPAFLIQAFDQKCGDYRNQGLILSKIGLIIMLEIGGVSARGVEKALEVMRGGGDNETALDALILVK